MQAALRTQAAETRPSSRDQYLAHWNAWAQQPTTADENRAEAVRRMTAWLNRAQPDTDLDLVGLHLTSLPEHLPASLEQLSADDNQLTRLPENLPASLTHLFVENNQLTRLPQNLPASLTHLDVDTNQLSSLPENLPTSLTHLDIRNNRFTSLPENLPASLDRLFASNNELTSLPENLPDALTNLVVSNNQLTSLPENITTRLSSDCSIELSNNPLPERVRSNLNAAMNAPNYHGPRIHFSMPGVARDEVATPLPEAVARWYDPADEAAVSQQWSAFSDEPHAQDFSNFLSRLHDTVNSASPQFKHNIAEWLSHLADHPSLRRDCFVISQDATTSCEDRVSLCLNTMKNARLTADVERGDYDHRLPELMTLAKGMFRLDQLEGIARQKVASLHFVDEIEVHLAYQVKLREPLALPVAASDMRFFNASYVSEQDLASATTQVQTAERERFPDFLASQWQPWQSVLQRLAPQQHAQAQDQLIEAMGEPFQQRLQQRLQALGLPNDPDAQRQIGPQVSADIAREINLPLTRKVLAERGLLSYIQPD